MLRELALDEPGNDVHESLGRGTADGHDLRVAPVALNAATSYRDLIIEPNQRQWRAAVERGVARGELTEQTDVDFVLNTLAGPLYFCLLITGEPIDPGYARAAVELLLARYGTAPG